MRCDAHGIDNPPEVVSRESLLKDERGGQVKRLGSAHGEVVDRAVDGERANVAARKKDWSHHKGVGGEGETRSIHLNNSLIIELIQNRIGERWKKHFFDELCGELTAAAVAEHDLLVLENR